MKKIVLLCLFAFLIAFTACQIPDSIQKPSATLKSFTVQSISLRDITFRFCYNIYNPYFVSLKLDGLDFIFYVEGKQLFATKTGKGLKIEARKNVENNFDVTLKYDDIIKIVSDYSKKEMLQCKVDVKILIPLPKIAGLPENLPFQYSVIKEIPALKPKVSLANFKIEKPSLSDISKALTEKKSSLNASTVQSMFAGLLSGKKVSEVISPSSIDIPIKLDFDIVLKNETAYKIAFSKLNYNFSIANSKLLNGVTKDIVTNNNECIIKVSNEFSSKNLLKGVLAVFNKKKGNFAFSGETSLKLPSSVKGDDLKLSFDEKGQFNIKWKMD